MCYFANWYYRFKLFEPLYLNTSRTLLCVLCNETLNYIIFAGTLISYHTHRQTHTQGTKRSIDWHTHINIRCYIYTTCYMHEAATRIILNHQLAQQKHLFYKGPQCFVFENLLTCRSYLLIRLKTTICVLWNKQNTNRNGINEQNSQTHCTQRER